MICQCLADQLFASAFGFRQNNNSPFYSYNTGGNEAGVDLVLIQPFLLYYVNLSCSFAN